MDYRIENGELLGARQCPSPNFGERPPGAEVDLVVIHCIALPPGCYGGEEIEAFFCNRLDWNGDPYFSEIRGMEVSAHLLIRRDGEVVQFVNFNDRAWHAGQSWFLGRGNCNDFSIGIELEGTDELAYTDLQYDVLSRVVAALLTTYPRLDAGRMVGHCDIAPERKTDPGAAFDWHRFKSMIHAASTE